jgi:toxin ParE1/3/4
MKKLVRRALADADILTALEYYIANAPEYALAFINDVEEAYQHIQQFPASGSSRYAYELSLPELRVWGCSKYPYLIFYVDCPSQIEVWRVLHSRSDIPATLQQEI